MNEVGWKRLLAGWPWYRGEGNFPLVPNSEFMSPVRRGQRPYGTRDTLPLAEDDPYGWPVTEFEEQLGLEPGLRDIAHHLFNRLLPCWRGEEHGIAAHKLHDNPYWPTELSQVAGSLEHERFVVIVPLALSVTQDDKAHLRWTLFGNSEQGPARPFWRGFFTAPGKEVPAEQGLAFFRDLLARAYEEPEEKLHDLLKVGFRILPLDDPDAPFPAEGPLPSWTEDYLLEAGASLRGVKYVLTFRPFKKLPAALRKKYLAGEVHLLPFPGSLLFWGVPSYQRLRRQLRLADQIPLLNLLDRHEGFRQLLIPQSGWFREKGPADGHTGTAHGPLRETYHRTFRQDRVHRHDYSLASASEHHMTKVLFSTLPPDIGLYHKPMGRNVQLWNDQFMPLLDGPRSGNEDLRYAAGVVGEGGIFGYRFVFPAMRLGKYEVYWHRPLVAYLDRHQARGTLVPSAPTGYLTAYHEDEEIPAEPVELWPRFLRRESHLAAVELFHHLEETPPQRTLTNVLKILDARERHGKPLSRTFARQLLTEEKRVTLEGWLKSLAKMTPHHEPARQLVSHLEECLEPAVKTPAKKAAVPHSLTYGKTATRAFEKQFWDTIYHLSSGEFANRNNGDCALDKHTQEALHHHGRGHAGRDLDKLGDYLLGYYAQLVAKHDMVEEVRFGELPFHWRTDYQFDWLGGWLNNQEGSTHERNLLVMIPGRDRSRAVIMADHYDAAFMYDSYLPEYGGNWARVTAPGADDNASATASLMLGAPVFMELSKKGKLDCDVWLIHLTGEEYPAEGQGACHLCQWLVEGSLGLGTTSGRHDLSGVRIQGLYVLDMVAHNRTKPAKEHDIFQISPGVCAESLWLAYQAHQAALTWNLSTEVWNRKAGRKTASRGKRSRDGRTLPAVAKFPELSGEVRLHYDPRSTLFNTDGQMFSDVGIPVVLFMENYDIDRVGYHDKHDNMTLIDLDYGAAFAAITIESVARAASEKVLGS
jgi:hypothetical protein